MNELNPEFAENAEPRCPCVLLLDTSGSMANEPIRLLNDGLRSFRESVVSDLTASLRVEVAVVTFNSEVRVVQQFVGASDFTPPTLSASGQTFMASGIAKALDLVIERQKAYGGKVASFRPWVVMITDGKPEGQDPLELENVRARLHAAAAGKGVLFHAFGTPSADFEVLSRLCTSERPPRELVGATENFKDLFLWLSRSLSKSVSRPVSEPQQVPLDSPGSGWSKLR